MKMLEGQTILKTPATVKEQYWLYCITTVAVIILGYLYQITPPYVFPLDDAYIVLHNAQVLHWGYDPNYPTAAALSGTTSAVHLALVALLFFLVTPVNALIFISWVAILLYAIGLLRLAFLLRASCLQASVFLVTGLTMGYAPFQLLNGLETGLVMATVTWVIIIFTTPHTHAWRYVLPFLCGIMPFLRPELALLSLLLLLLRWRLYQKENQSKTILYRLIVNDLLLATVGALPWMLWYWIDTGAAIPQTIAAKMAYYAETKLSLGSKLAWAGRGIFGIIMAINFLGVLGMSVLLLTTALGRIGLLFILIFVATYIYTAPAMLQNSFNAGRYFYPCLPILLYGAISSIKSNDKILRYFANFILAITLCTSLWHLPQHWRYYVTWRSACAKAFSNITQWCQQNLPKNAIILIHDAGYLAFTTHFHLVDMVGLKTPSSVYYHQHISVPTEGKGRNLAIGEICKKNHVQFIVIEKNWEKSFKITPGLKLQGWQLDTLYPHTEEVFSYAVYRITAPPIADNASTQLHPLIVSAKR